MHWPAQPQRCIWLRSLWRNQHALHVGLPGHHDACIVSLVDSVESGELAAEVIGSRAWQLCAGPRMVGCLWEAVGWLSGLWMLKASGCCFTRHRWQVAYSTFSDACQA